MSRSTNTIWSQGILNNGGADNCVEEISLSEQPVASTTPEVTLSKEQNDILEVVRRGGNVFFTGPAGTGKSVLLRAIIRKLLETEGLDTVAITATTGIAALAIGGQTLHSYGGIGTGSEYARFLARKIMRNRKVRARWLKTRVWIIDEISMLKAEIFDKLEYIARCIRGNSRPFGGIQLVLAGDFFQLPPVSKTGSATPADYAFKARTWEDCIPHPYFLREVFRQKDHTFVDILSSMRIGSLNPQQIDILRGLERPLSGGAAAVEPAYLLSSREQVAAQNEHQLALLQGPIETYVSMERAGWDVYRQPLTNQAAKKQLNSGTLAPERLVLKVGAQVMLVQNVVQGVLVNGSIGKIVDFMTIGEARREGLEISDPSDNNENDNDSDDGLDYDEDADFQKPPAQPPQYQHQTYIEERILRCYNDDPSIAKRPTGLRDITSHVFLPGQKYPVVHFTNDRKLLCVPMFFDHIGIMGNIEARRIQVPLILSWAITIHKSQGQTLDFVKVDFEKMFAHGQAYVAVSRATSMDGLQLANFRPNMIHANPRVLQWHSQWQKYWEDPERRPIVDVVTNSGSTCNTVLEKSSDDAELYDSYNTEISGEWLEEHELSAEMAADSSWVDEVMTDDSEMDTD